MNTDQDQTAGIADYDGALSDWLYLSHTHGIGNTTFQQLLKHLGSVSNILSANKAQLSALDLPSSTRTRIIDSLLNKEQIDISADLEWSRQENHHLITYYDGSYPQRLKQLSDAPPLLYVRGDTDYLNQPQLAMVGTRNPTAIGRKTANEFAHHLSDAGITITSGLASGIDAASHEGALSGIAGTIAVVAHGLDIVYPAQHQALAQRIAENGAVVSEMPIGMQPQRGFFPRRNRLISALSLGTIVVEAARKSGSLITAKFASEQNKEVFAIPGSIHNPMARGCHKLIQQGAKLVETADDILVELCLDDVGTPNYPQKSEKNIHENPEHVDQVLDPDHQKLLKCLAYEPSSIDELVQRSQFAAAEIASMLLILELEGIVACQGGRYTRIS